MALQHLDQHSSYPGALDGYTSYSSDSSAPRTPSPREDSSYPAVFTPEMHQQHSWAPPPATESYHQYPSDHPREYEPKTNTPPPHPPAQQQHQQPPPEHPGTGPRRNTFPSVPYDREDRAYGPPSGYHHPPPPGSAPMYEHHEQHQQHYPPPPSGSPHPPYQEYDHYGRPYYHPHAHMLPPHTMGHPHPMGLTYISPHTGLPVQHTDDAASKETQYLRRRCFNCHTTEPPSWRRSTLNPGKIVCNKCGLYERTHLRPRPLRFDELRAGNKARKAQPSATKKGPKGAMPVAQSPLPPAPAMHPNNGMPTAEDGKNEPRDYSLVRRSSVSSSVGSSNGAPPSDWESAYSSNSSSAPTSHPATAYSSPSSQSYPLPQRTDSHSPQPPSVNGDGIRLPSASLTASPLVQQNSPHLGGSPQLLHHSIMAGRSPPRKSHTYPSLVYSREPNGSNHTLVGDSPPA